MTAKPSRTTVARTLLGSVSLLAATFAALPARADTGEATAAAPAAQADSAAPQPGEILVTASRRQESAKNVPVAVTAINGEKLDVLNSSGLDIRFLSSRTPSLQIESSFGRTFPRFYIRGLGNTDFDPNAAQPVSVVMDDVALENPFLKSFPVFDLQNVEVLRGPQGTLFGRNTPAGVVKLDSAKPSDTFGGYLSGSWATYNTVNVEGAVGGPIADGLSFRASGILQRRDNWITNDDTTGNGPRKLEGYRDLAGRFQLAYKSGDFHALLNVHGRDLKGTPRVFRAGLFIPGSNDFRPDFDPKHVSQDGISYQKMSQWGTNLHLDYHFEGIGTLYSITGYESGHVNSIGDIDGGSVYPDPFVPALNAGMFADNTGDVVRPHEFSQELRFASEDMNGLRLQGGAYYFHQRLKYDETDFGTTGAKDGDIFHDDRNENVGVFASAEYKATSKLTLRAGVRYSHDSKRDFVSGCSDAFGAVSTPDHCVVPSTARAKGHDVTWDASATYALTDQLNLYTRVATGYQGPAIQDRVTFGSQQSVAKKQTTLSAEGGMKFESRDHRLHFDFDGYWWKTKDLQLTAVGGQSNSASLINADHAIGYGLEAQLDIRPLPHLDLTAGGSWNFTQIRDPNVAVGACGGGCTVTDPTETIAGTTFAFINGNSLPQAPRYVANVTARYAIPMANGGEIFAYTDWAYRSHINYFLYTAEEFTGRSLLEGGLKVGYKTPSHIEIAGFVRNITNQIRSISAIDFNNLTGMINEPRIIGGEVRVAF